MHPSLPQSNAHPLFDLSDHVIVVTGAGQGIGRVFAQFFAQAGAVVVVADINEDKALRVSSDINAAQGRAMAMPVDVTDQTSVMAMVEHVSQRYGRLDTLINNAGLFSTLAMRPFDQIPSPEWDKVMHTNVTGVFNCCRAVAPVMRSARRGRIINMGSSAVTMGRPLYLHYTTSKAALIGMTRSLARELGPDGITVNTILPGATYTEIERATVTPEQKQRIVQMQCLPRPETPQDLVGTAMFLASDASAFLTGQSISVDGGATHL